MQLNFNFSILSFQVCGGYLTESQGILSSPNYPSDYGRNLDCVWVIRARPGRTIQFEFLNMDINSDDAQCGQDYLMARKTFLYNSANVLTI